MPSSFPLLKIGLTTVCMVAFIGASWGSFSKGKRTQKERGLIESVDCQGKAIVIGGPDLNRSVQFTWDEQTTLYNNDERVSPEKLQPGDRIEVFFRTSGRERLAERIEIHPVFAESQPTTENTDANNA